MLCLFKLKHTHNVKSILRNLRALKFRSAGHMRPAGL